MSRSIVSHRRSALGFVTLVAMLCALVLLPAAQATTPKPASDYLALGDSLAYGYQAAKFNAEYPNVVPSTFDTGYADVLGSWLQSLKRPIDTTNYGCPGESSDSFRFGGRGAATGYTFVPNPFICGDQPATGIGAIYSKAWLHDFYGGSQLDAALGFLRKHPHTSPITLDIGANDTLIFLEQCGFGAVPNCVTPAAIGNLFAHIGGNVAAIVTALREAAPRAEIVVMGLYNAYPTVLPGGDALTKALNTTLRTVATGLGAGFADPLPVFNPASVTGGSEVIDIPTICLFTAMCPGGIFNPASPLADIHPTDTGYATLASIIAAALPYQPSLTP